MKTTKKIDSKKLILEGVNIRKEMSAKKKRLEEIEGELLGSLEKGKHEGIDGSSCIVVDAEPGISVTKENADELRGLVGEEVFGKLTTRTPSVTYRAVSGFRDVLAAFVKKPAMRKVLKLVEKKQAPYVKWP